MMQVLKQLHRVLKPEGSIKLIDYGRLDQPENANGAIQSELWKLDKVLALLSNSYGLTEYPHEHIEERMREAGFTISDVSLRPALWDAKWLWEYTVNIERRIQRLPIEYRSGFLHRLKFLYDKANEIIEAEGHIINGSVYTIEATK
jgi:hypothetical protein